jgi:hypothetical protein
MNSFNDTVVPFLWFALILLSGITPLVIIIAWIQIVYVERNLWLLFLMVVGIGIAIVSFNLGYLPIVLCIFLFVMILNRRIVRQGYSKTHRHFINVINSIIMGILIVFLWFSYTEGWDIWQWNVYSRSTYIITVMNVFLTMVLVAVMYLYPLNTQGKTKSGYHRDRTWEFIGLAMLLSVLIGLYIYENRYSFICTSLGVLFPSVILHRLSRKS